METNFVDFGSIEQYSNICKTIAHKSRLTGVDEQGNPVYDHSKTLPIVEVVASEKIHGTNAGIGFSNPYGLFAQSRGGIISMHKDNAGFAFFVNSHKDAITNLIKELAAENNLNLDTTLITLYGEWAGGNIQKNSAVSGTDKKLFLFQHFMVSPMTSPSYWLETKLSGNWAHLPDNNIFNVMNYPTYTFTVDFNNPKLHQNQFVDLVNKIEENSPLGQAFGVQGNIAEGIVCTFMYNGELYRFKVKGDKHSSSKVVTLSLVDEEKESVKIEFANNACPAWRLEQMWQNIFGIDNEKNIPNIKFTADFIRAVINDVLKEESNTMAEKGLEPKEVNSKISKIAREWFLEQLQEFNLKG